MNMRRPPAIAGGLFGLVGGGIISDCFGAVLDHMECDEVPCPVTTLGWNGLEHMGDFYRLAPMGKSKPAIKLHISVHFPAKLD